MDQQLFPPAVDFGKMEYDKAYEFVKVFDGVKEQNPPERGWTVRVILDSVEHNMFLNRGSPNHCYMYQELMKVGAGEIFYFVKIEYAAGKGTAIKYFVKLEEPNVEKLRKECIGDKSLSQTERTYLSCAALMTFGKMDEKVLIETYQNIARHFPRNLTLNPDQRNMLWMASCLYGGGVLIDDANEGINTSTVEEMIKTYNSLTSTFLTE